MITAKQKRSPVRLIISLVILGLIVGGIATVVVQQETGNASASPDFSMSLQTGQATDDKSTWRNLAGTETLLNGTNGLNNQGLKIIVSIGSQGTFNSFVRLNVSGLPPGVTFTFRPIVLRTVPGGNASSSLIFRAAANVTSQAVPYNVTVTAKSSSPLIVHAVSFPLRIRATKLFWSPSILSVTKGEKFTLSLLLSDVYNVTSFQFTGGFNSTLITALSNGTRFNPDFSNFGYIVQQTRNPPCLWVDNSTGVLGNCGMGAAIIGNCLSAPCITVNATQTYDLLNQTFVANVNYSGFTPVTLAQDLVVETNGEVVISNDPHHTVGSLVTVAEIVHTPAPVQTSGPITSPYGPVGLLVLLPLFIRALGRKTSGRVAR